jgi:hypothetical protein
VDHIAKDNRIQKQTNKNLNKGKLKKKMQTLLHRHMIPAESRAGAKLVNITQTGWKGPY